MSSSRVGVAGLPGQDASPPQAGQAGGEVELRLSVVDEIVRASGHVRLVSGELRALDSSVPLHELGSIFTSARGGAGGDGGAGGTGGNGGVGRDGFDYNDDGSVVHGEPGGCGGNGGRGTHGAFGGHGGTIRVLVHERDAYLLAALTGTHDPSSCVAGGVGGQPGSHGCGGRGGAGGRGGFDLLGGRGRRGAVAANGWTPNVPLYAGRSGGSGSLEIHVQRTDRVDVYPSPFELEVVGFELGEDANEEPDGIFELGEIVHAARIRLRNVGGMPSPAGVRVTLAESVWIKPQPLEDAIVLDRSLAPGEEVELSGTLRFMIARPSIDEPSDPYVAVDTVVPIVEQLGPGHSRFARRYDRAHAHRSMTIQFPVQNGGGIVCLRSIAPGERTLVSFGIDNVSRRAIGGESECRRLVGVQIEIVSADLDPSQLVLVDADGNEAPRASGLDGWWFELASLDPQHTAHVGGRIGVAEGVVPYAGISLRATLWLADLRDPSRRVAVQRRVAEIRVEPAYRDDPDAQVVLVTHDGTTRDTYLAWRALLRDELGLSFVTWSVARYGHLDHEDDVDEATRRFAGRLVVVLDQPFRAAAGGALERPSQYLEAAEIRRAAMGRGTRYLVVGAREAFALAYVLAPANGMELRDEHRDVDSFLCSETMTRDRAVEQALEEHAWTRFDRVALTMLETAFPFDPACEAVRLATELHRELTQLHPTRRYVLVLRQHDRPRRIESALGMLPRYELGTVDVRRSLDLETPSIVHAAVPDVDAGDLRVVRSGAMRYAVIALLAFGDKVELLRTSLRRGAVDVAHATTQAILADLSREQSALVVDESDAGIEDVLPKLRTLAQLPIPSLVPGTPEGWPILHELIAALEALCHERAVWWRLWGRRARAMEQVREEVGLLRAAVLADDAPPDSSVAIEAHVERLRAQARTSAGDTVSVLFALQRMLEQPHCDSVVVDADIARDPSQLIWTPQQLATLAAAETERTAAQLAARLLNTSSREHFAST